VFTCLKRMKNSRNFNIFSALSLGNILGGVGSTLDGVALGVTGGLLGGKILAVFSILDKNFPITKFS